MIRATASLVLLVVALCAQPAPAPRFEVAAIRLTPADQWNGPSGGKTGKGKLTMHNRTLKRYIMGAYGLGPNQIVGGPAWLDSDRFDIEARAGQPVDDDGALMAMLQTLLAERFQLAIYHEGRPIEAYVLVVARNGPGLEKALEGESTTNSGHGSIDARSLP